MNSNRAIKIFFCGAHAHGHCKALQHFARVFAYHMQANDLFVLASADFSKQIVNEEIHSVNE